MNTLLVIPLVLFCVAAFVFVVGVFIESEKLVGIGAIGLFVFGFASILAAGIFPQPDPRTQQINDCAARGGYMTEYSDGRFSCTYKPER